MADDCKVVDTADTGLVLVTRNEVIGISHPQEDNNNNKTGRGSGGRAGEFGCFKKIL